MDLAAVKHISECFIKPMYEVAEATQPYHLAPWDLLLLSGHYIQKGLLFQKPLKLDDQEYSTNKLLRSLRNSLSLPSFISIRWQVSLPHKYEDRHECLVYVDCNKGPGAKFIHASLDMTISDILSPTDVPLVVKSLFDHHLAINHDGHTRPLLSVQVTELLDGVFIGCSMNHAVANGTSYWHFWNTWSEIHRAKGNEISLSRIPIIKCWFQDEYGLAFPLPFIHPDEFITRYEPPQLRERFFHFSSDSIAKLKAMADRESNTNKISSFQALSALVWRSITQANRLPHDQVTCCRLVTNNRQRLDPPLPPDYFGNTSGAAITTTTTSELLQHSLGWAALLLHEAVRQYTDKTVRDFLKEWLQSPFTRQYGTLYVSNCVSISSSPRFDMYENTFGLGKVVAVRSGHSLKDIGHVISYPGFEGGGSVDLEICLPPDSMRALETDEEFMAAVSLPYKEN